MIRYSRPGQRSPQILAGILAAAVIVSGTPVFAAEQSITPPPNENLISIMTDVGNAPEEVSDTLKKESEENMPAATNMEATGNISTEVSTDDAEAPVTETVEDETPEEKILPSAAETDTLKTTVPETFG